MIFAALLLICHNFFHFQASMHSLPHMIMWHGIPVFFFREWHEEVVCCGMEDVSTLMINKFRMKDITNKVVG